MFTLLEPINFPRIKLFSIQINPGNLEVSVGQDHQVVCWPTELDVLANHAFTEIVTVLLYGDVSLAIYFSQVPSAVILRLLRLFDVATLAGLVVFRRYIQLQRRMWSFVVVAVPECVKLTLRLIQVCQRFSPQQILF